MTVKQEKILQSALQLFALEGYHATSTSKVAKQAGVSEGLIFKHYTSKEGLLNAVVEEGEKRFKNLYAEIVLEDKPRQVIKKTLELPFIVPEEEYGFWKLQFKLKWELKDYNTQKMQPMMFALSNAFKNLEYDNPELEAELVLHILDGVASAILKDMVTDKEELRNFILTKYKL
ncbi:MAG TPA: TetR/AcrR family transcriptional regulator [Fulvivirga sp.]|nr:TetR/AcrR family transcriptional regulator [Fulvivirga sp.]